jgi:midasin
MGDADEDQAQNQQFDDTNVIEQQDREMNAPHFPDNKEDVDMDDAAAQPEEHSEQSDKQQTEGQQPGAMVGKPREDHFNGEGETEFSKMDVDGIEDIAPADELPLNQVHAQEQDLARPREEARQLWQKYEASTRELAVGLCEQLRLILEPTQATKMRGDYRTGKRLNMKRIIPYIASSFKKDKIWMRRSKPSKRQYQVLISVDDSRSMSESGAVDLTFQTVALIAKALSQLEVGQIGISSFGDTTELVHPFEKPFTAESGVEVFGRFGFKQDKTDVKALVEKSLGYFESQSLSSASSNSAEISQLQLIISDGVCEDHETLLRLVRRAREQKIMVVFVILDSGRQGEDERIPDQSILDMQTVDFKNGEMIIKRYLDSFPFEYYLVVKDVKELPGVLALALRQWLSEIVNSGG